MRWSVFALCNKARWEVFATGLRDEGGAAEVPHQRPTKATNYEWGKRLADSSCFFALASYSGVAGGTCTSATEAQLMQSFDGASQ